MTGHGLDGWGGFAVFGAMAFALGALGATLAILIWDRGH